MSHVQCRDGFCLQTLRRRHYHRMHEPDSQRRISRADPLRGSEIILATPLYRKQPISEIGKERFLSFWTQVPGNQVINFRQNRGWQDPARSRFVEELLDSAMGVF